MKNLFTLLLMFTCSFMSFAQFAEDFEGDLSSWSLDLAWVQGSAEDLSSTYFTIPGNSSVLVVNDDAAGNGVDLSGMATTPAFTVPNSADATLLFNYYFIDGDYGGDETAKVFISTDGGLNYIEILDLAAVADLTAFDLVEFSMADYAGQEVVLAFEYQDGAAWNYGFVIDNVIVYKPVADNVKLSSASVTEITSINTDNEVSFNVFNFGNNQVNSLTIEWTDGTNTYEETVSVEMAPFTSASFTHADAANFAIAGSYTIDCSITAVNGNLDADASDNEILGLDVLVLSQVGTKRVLFEEATGTWCGFCPRGALAMEHMQTNYPDQFVGVAVHAGDPMQITEYDALGNLIGGYPNAVIDRAITNASVSVNAFESYLDTRLAAVAPADIMINNTLDGSNLNIDVTSTFYANFSEADYRLLVIITEDGVTGTGSGYNQVNYYAGGGLGPMGGYENLPDPVPAADMVYDHVGRAIITGFDGLDGSIPTEIVADEAMTYSFTYDVPDEFVDANCHIVAAIIDNNTGRVINVNSVAFAPNSNKELEDVVGLKVFPNPTVSDINVTFDASGDYQVFLTNLSGKVVATQSFTSLAGAQEVNFQVAHLPAGSYVLTVAGETAASSKMVIIK